MSPLHCDGSPHFGAANVDGAVLVAARRRKERTYLDRACLVVLAGEIGGSGDKKVSVSSGKGQGQVGTPNHEERSGAIVEVTMGRHSGLSCSPRFRRRPVHARG